MPEWHSAAHFLLIQQFNSALQNHVLAGFTLRLIRIGTHRFAILVSFDLRLRLLYHLARSHARVLNGLASRRVVFRDRQNNRTTIIHRYRAPQRSIPVGALPDYLRTMVVF